MRFNLSGEIRSNDEANLYRYFGITEVCCPSDVQRAISKCPEGEELVIEMNSGGGNVYAGFEMYTALRACKRKTVAEVHSIAGSAMSVVAAACDTVLMSPVGNAMIHLSSAEIGCVNAVEAEKYAQMLKTIDESILNAYEEKVRGKTTRATLKSMMKRETFLTAQEAIDCGLADGMLFSDERQEESQEPFDMKAFVASIYDTGVFNRLPPIETLRAKKAELEKLNHADHQEGGDQNNPKKEEPIMDFKEIKSTDELMAAYPELTAQIGAEARNAERERIAAIDEQSIPGFEGIIAEAKADPTKTAGDVAMQIIAEAKRRDKNQGMNYLSGVRKDAEGDGSGGVNNVHGNPIKDEDGGNTPENDIEAAAKRAVAMFEKGGVM